MKLPVYIFKVELSNLDVQNSGVSIKAPYLKVGT